MDDQQNQIKLASFFNELRNIENFKDTLLTIYLEELEENIYLILKLKAEFYNFIIEKINFNIIGKYSKDVFTNPNFTKINSDIKNDFLDDYLNPISKFLEKTVENQNLQIKVQTPIHKNSSGKLDNIDKKQSGNFFWKEEKEKSKILKF